MKTQERPIISEKPGTARPKAPVYTSVADVPYGFFFGRVGSIEGLFNRHNGGITCFDGANRGWPTGFGIGKTPTDGIRVDRWVKLVEVMVEEIPAPGPRGTW